MVRRRDPRLHAQPGAVVQDVVAAARDGRARAGSPVVHRRRPRRAHHDDARSRCASTGPERETRTFHAEVARNRRLTPMLASMVVANAVADAEPDVTDMIVTVTSQDRRARLRPLELTRSGVLAARASRPARCARRAGCARWASCCSTRSSRSIVDRWTSTCASSSGATSPRSSACRCPATSVRAGDTVPLRVTLRPYAGPEYVETVPVEIPRTVAGETRQGRGRRPARLVRPDVRQPESLRGYIDNLRKFYTAASIVVSLQTPDDGASLRGRLIPDLPESALDTLRPGNQTRRADAYRVADRTVFPSQRSSAASRSSRSRSRRRPRATLDLAVINAANAGAIPSGALQFAPMRHRLVVVRGISVCTRFALRSRARRRRCAPRRRRPFARPRPRTSRRAKPPAA